MIFNLKSFLGILFVIESMLLFLCYTLIPRVIELSSAAFLNVNLLTSDFYTVFLGVFIKKIQVSLLLNKIQVEFQYANLKIS